MNTTTASELITVVIADDEMPAREKLSHQLSLLDNIEVVGVATTGKEAIALINQQKPDLALLDIQMPEIDGIELVDLLEHKPLIIFTTAYDQYAIRAFEQASIDYLLKPFPLARLKNAIDKAKLAIKQNQQTKLQEQFSLHQSGEKKRLISKQNDRITLLSPQELYFIKSEQGSSFANNGEHSYLLSETLDQLEQALMNEEYIRIHRSYIVNLDKIKEIQPWFNGKLMVIMNDENKTELSTSRSGADKLKQRLGI